MMNRRNLGLTNFKVSELCLGTMHFGWRTDEARAFDMLDAFYAAGGNFIQSVCYYPDEGMPTASPNRSEEMVGRWLKARGMARSEVVLATRLVIGRGEAAKSLPRVIAAAAHASVQRLGTSYLDLLVLEWSDALQPISAALETMNDLVRTGVVQEFGVAGFPTWRIADSIARAYLRGRSRLEVVQGDYSLLRRDGFEGDLAALCAEQRLGFVARAPLAGGLLYRTESHALIGAVALQRANRSRAQTEQATPAERVAERYGVSVPQVALAWVLQNPGVSSAIVGVRSVAELGVLVDATRVALTPADRRELTIPVTTQSKPPELTLA